MDLHFLNLWQEPLEQNLMHHADTAAFHVEFGIGFAAGLYFSGSGGVGFDVPELKTAKITSTTC